MTVLWTSFLFVSLTVIFTIYSRRVRKITGRIFHISQSMLRRFITAIHRALRGIMLGIVLVLGAATAVRFYFVSWLGERVVADLRRDVQAHLLRLDPGFFELNRPSEIASRLTADTAVLEQVVATSASLSLMFPTIYGLALQGLGEDAKFGSAGLVMAILGGAIMPMIHAAVMDVAGSSMGYIVPAICLALVAAYALFDLRNTRPGIVDEEDDLDTPAGGAV